MRFSVVVTAATAMAGCGWIGGGSPLTSDETLLRYVPADSPFVLAALESYPDEIADLMSRQLQSALSTMQAAMDANADDTSDAAAMALFSGLLSPETLAATGINRDSTFVLYGAGILPVMRVTLAEGHDMDGVLDNVNALMQLAGAEVLFQTADVAGATYRYIPADDVRLIVTVLDDELILTAVPEDLADADLRTVLGIDLPAQSIAASGRLATIADEYGFTPQMAGFFDVERLTATFLDPPTATNAAIFDLIEYDATEHLDSVCRDEIRAMSGIAPLMVAGYTELSDEVMAINFVTELREDLAEGLSNVPGSAEGLGVVTDALMSFGLSIDIPAARDFIFAQLDVIEADPFECEFLAGINEGVPSARMSLNQPVLPIIESVGGFSATLDLGEPDFAGLEELPPGSTLAILVSTGQVASTLSMASLFIPEFASLGLTANGEISEIQLPPAFADPSMNPFGAAYFVGTDSAIGLGLGEEGDARLEELLDAPAADPETLMSMSLDIGAYYGLMATMLDDMPAEFPVAGGTSPLPLFMSVNDMMRDLEDAYSRETIEIKFSERGIEVPVRLNLNL